jgi:hypothetical protein
MDFVFTWPVWLLATEESIRRDEAGTPIGLTERPSLRVARDGDKVRLVVFTDRQLADRYVSRLKDKLIPVALQTPEQFADWLWSFAMETNCSTVLFDPEPAGTIYSVRSVIEALQRGPE